MAKEPVATIPELSGTTSTVPAKPVTDYVDVVLIAAHEHNGELKQPGDTIQVNQRQHQFLRAQGKIE